VPEGERFVCVAGSQPMDAAVPEARRGAEVGTIIETCPGAAATVYEVAGRLVEQGGAALLIDYGHDQIRDGSTLQAVRDHLKVDPFVNPGEADLTAHVDFATLAPIALSRGCKWLGTVPQGRWLRNLGIEARAQALSERAPEHAAAIASARDRLIGEGQMGLLFKVMGQQVKKFGPRVHFPQLSCRSGLSGHDNIADVGNAGSLRYALAKMDSCCCICDARWILRQTTSQ